MQLPLLIASDMKKYLVVYNICEINHRNCEWYIKCIDSLLASTYKEFDFAISGCLISPETKKDLQKKYSSRAFLNFIDSRLPVNITFNHTVNKIVEMVGRYDGYVYVDSGIDVAPYPNYLNEIDARFSTGKYELVWCQTDTDTGFHHLGVYGYFYDHDFIVPVGKACNLHVACFGDTWLRQYKKIIPDIFLAYCTESVFSFLTAALKSRWVIIKDMILPHAKSTDGASAGFDHIGNRRHLWNNLYGGLDMLDIINDPVARRLGLGYEECSGIMMHDPACFCPKGFAKHAELKNYIRDKLFLSDDVLNYSHIPYQFLHENKLTHSHPKESI